MLLLTSKLNLMVFLFMVTKYHPIQAAYAYFSAKKISCLYLLIDINALVLHI